MKALYKRSTEKYDLELRRTKIPEPEKDEVIIDVKAVGICGTDLKMYQGMYFNHKTPIVLGHEFSGVISSIGDNVKGMSLGQKVTARPAVSFCGRCHRCIEGKPNLCKYKNRLGFEQNGAFAEYVKVKQDQVFILPNEVDLLSGSMVEPMAVVLHAIRDIKVKPSDVVHIIGPGSIGLLALLLNKANGAKVSISGLSNDREKLSLARNLGADLVTEDDTEDTYELLMDKTEGKGADVILECSGTEAGVDKGLELCKAGGQYVQIGTWSKPINIDFMKIAYKEIKVSGSYSHTTIDWLDSIKILQEKKIDITPLIQGVYSLNEWQRAFNKAENRGLAKIILKP